MDSFKPFDQITSVDKQHLFLQKMCICIVHLHPSAVHSCGAGKPECQIKVVPMSDLYGYVSIRTDPGRSLPISLVVN